VSMNHFGPIGTIGHFDYARLVYFEAQ
jgi:hypothetical protein